MASTGHLVWVGFIDDLPVVGSVKEAVEWVLAVAADDLGLATLKLDAINGRLELKSKQDEFSRSSSGYASDSSSSSSSKLPSVESAGQAAMDVASVLDTNLKDYIIEAPKGKGKARPQTGGAQMIPKTSQKKLEDIQQTTLEKIKKIDQNFYFKTPLDDDGKRSNRGEHVINNDVILFYHRTVEDFLKESFRQIDIRIESPLDAGTREAIQDKLVVHFDENELYINANALIYGMYSRQLKQALKDWLSAAPQEDVEGAQEDVAGNVNRIVQIMNEVQAYVDWLARDKYIGNQDRRRVFFETIRREVETMFINWHEHLQPAKNVIDA